MRRGFLARVSLLAVSCATLATAAPLSLGFLTLNTVGSDLSGDGLVEFRLQNFTGLVTNGTPSSHFATPITFTNVNLDITWAGGAPPGIVGPLDWYLDSDSNVHNASTWISSFDLAPNTRSYESTRFQRKYGIEKGVITFDLNPEQNWLLTGGGSYTPPGSTYSLVFWITPAATFGMSSDALPGTTAWDFYLANPVPEPATYLMGALGVVGALMGSRFRRTA